MAGMSGSDSVEGRDSYGGGFWGGIKGLSTAMKSAAGNIARDLSMGSAAGMFANRDKQAENLAARGYDQAQIKDYFDRTDATTARRREQAKEQAEKLAKERAEKRAEKRAQARQAAPAAPVGVPAQEQGPVYRNPFGSQNQLKIAPPWGEVTPDMRREALRIFESQRGAGQIPYQMLPYQQGLGSMRRPGYMPGMGYSQSRMQPAVMPRMSMLQPMQPNPNVSPAFQYAAQNYQRLGGSQRLMDRPMEMMSVGERQRINEMTQGMADTQRPTPFPGKGAGGVQKSEALRHIMPIISQMGIASFR